MFEVLLMIYVLVAFRWTAYRYLEVQEPIIRPWLKSIWKATCHLWYRLLNHIHNLFQ